jgi:NADH-quinone oxidoreductase subunit E
MTEMAIPAPTEITHGPDGLCDNKRAALDEIISANIERPGALMVILNTIQNTIGYVSPDMERYVAQKLRVPVGAVHGVVTFYSFFTTASRGKNTVKFCMGTACYVGGVPQLIEKAKAITGTDMGTTTPDGQLTLELCRCVGACSQAPVITINDEVVGKIKPNKFPQLIKKLLEG